MSNLPALLFGGAFNPPTKAHIHLAELALAETGRRQVIFMPSKSRYIEEDQGKDFAYSEEKRLALLKSAAFTDEQLRELEDILKSRKDGGQP